MKAKPHLCKKCLYGLTGRASMPAMDDEDGGDSKMFFTYCSFFHVAKGVSGAIVPIEGKVEECNGFSNE